MTIVATFVLGDRMVEAKLESLDDLPAMMPAIERSLFPEVAALRMGAIIAAVTGRIDGKSADPDA